MAAIFKGRVWQIKAKISTDGIELSRLLRVALRLHNTNHMLGMSGMITKIMRRLTALYHCHLDVGQFLISSLPAPTHLTFTLIPSFAAATVTSWLRLAPTCYTSLFLPVSSASVVSRLVS